MVLRLDSAIEGAVEKVSGEDYRDLAAFLNGGGVAPTSKRRRLAACAVGLAAVVGGLLRFN